MWDNIKENVVPLRAQQKGHRHFAQRYQLHGREEKKALGSLAIQGLLVSHGGGISRD